MGGREADASDERMPEPPVAQDASAQKMETGRRYLAWITFAIRLYAAGIGVVIGELLGSFDDLLYALIVFVVTTTSRACLKPSQKRNCRVPLASRKSARRFASSPLLV